jgi:hypothetical protein
MGGHPGQRVTSTQGIVTEVKIPVTQAAVGIVALLLTAFAIQRLVIVRFGDWYLLTHPDQFASVVWWQRFIWNAFVVISCCAPLFYLGASMLMNVVNPNLPAPMAAQNPDDVKLPWPIRIAMGYGGLPWPFSAVLDALVRRDDPQPARQMNAPTATAPADHTITATLQWHPSENRRVTYLSKVSLLVSEWERLAGIARANGGFSARDLHRAGFKSPRDREIAALLQKERLAIQQGRAVTLVESFRRWLVAGSWQRPTPSDGGQIIM